MSGDGDNTPATLHHGVSPAAVDQTVAASTTSINATAVTSGDNGALHQQLNTDTTAVTCGDNCALLQQLNTCTTAVTHVGNDGASQQHPDT